MENMKPATFDATRSEGDELILLGNILNNLSLIAEYADTVSAEDFTFESWQNLYRILQSYYAIYGNEEVTDNHLDFTASKLIYESKLSMSKGKKDKLVCDAMEVKRIGSVQSADSEAYQNVKRCSVLRKLRESGINIDDICQLPELTEMTAEDVMAQVYERLDPLANAVTLHPHEDFSGNITERALRFFEKPEIGLQTPFAFINEYMHGLCPNDFTLIGGLSNTGKGRFLMSLLVWLVAKEGQTVCLLSNEMTGEDFFKAMVCTIVNNPELHDKKLKLTQTDIVQSRFRDENGEYIERLPGETGIDFHARVVENSAECQDYEAVLRWWEETFPGKFIFVNVANDYSTSRLKREIRRAKAKGCTVIAYDTLKGYQSTEWGDLVQATTELSEMIKSDREGLVGLATFQLTDDVAKCKPEELSSLNIARAKGIMHLADNILMFMPLRNQLKDGYVVVSHEEIDEYGEPLAESIDDDISIAAFRIIKNRRGGGKERVFAVQNNLDTNRWIYIGDLVPGWVLGKDWQERLAS